MTESTLTAPRSSAAFARASVPARTERSRVVLCEFPPTGVPGVPTFSPFCAKVRMALALAEVRFTSRPILKPGDLGKLNPAKQLPVLIVDDAVVRDSTAILSRIELLAPGSLDGGLDEVGRAESWLWEEMADSVLNGFFVAARWHDDDNWPRLRAALFGRAPWSVRTLVAPWVRREVKRRLVARDVTRGGDASRKASFAQTLDRMDARAPADGYWLGPRIARADLAITAQLHGLRTAITPNEGAAIDARPRLRRYLDRVVAATHAHS